MVCVPAVVPSVPPMRKNPVMGFLSDHFQRPYPFSPTVVVDIEPVLDTVIDMIDCHESQFYEWMPWIGFFDAPMPTGLLERKQFLREKILAWIAPLADRHRDRSSRPTAKSEAARSAISRPSNRASTARPSMTPRRKRLFPMVPWKD